MNIFGKREKSKLMEQTESFFLDLFRHQSIVRGLMNEISEKIRDRGAIHDDSKTKPGEVELYAQYAPMLWRAEYESPEYKEIARKMMPAIRHHFRMNRHHPEHHGDGVDGMCLLDLIEMLCDWKAASMRGDRGSFADGMDTNKEKYGIDDQLWSILENTAMAMGFYDE